MLAPAKGEIPLHFFALIFATLCENQKKLKTLSEFKTLKGLNKTTKKSRKKLSGFHFI